MRSEIASVAYGVGTLCAILVGLGVVFFVRTKQFLARATHTVGIVVELVAHRGAKGVTTYRPVIEFTLGTATSRFESKLGANPAQFFVGERVPIAYDRDNPLSVRVVKATHLYLLPGILIGIGLMIGVMTAALLVLANDS